MNPLISNLLMQPKPTGAEIERPQTLIEKLQARRDQFNSFSRYEVFDKTDLADTVQTCIDIVEGHSDWVPVSERLPDEDGRYLVHLKNGLVTTDIYVRHSGQWVNYDIIKNWQPLPQPPSEVQL